LFARKLGIRANLLDLGVLEGVLVFKARNEKYPLALAGDDQCDRALGGDEDKASVVLDKLIVEEYQSCQV
jgi:hypothetical protein